MKLIFNILYRTVFYIIFISLILLVTEFVLSFTGSNYYDKTEYISSILKQDSVLIWKQREELNKKFFNYKLKTNFLGLRSHEIGPKETKRLVCLGSSPTFGLGVDYESTYPYVVGEMLSANGNSVETINAGEIGFSAFQGLNFFRNIILDLEPDIVTVSYLINDIDRYRYFRNSEDIPDSRLGSVSETNIFISNFIQNTHIYRSFKHFISKSKSAEEKYFGKKMTSRRVSEKEYEELLTAFVDIAKANNVKLIFLVMPVNSPKREPLPYITEKEIDEKTATLELLMKNSEYKEAKKCINEILSLDKYNAVSFYYSGLIAEKEGNRNLAEECFKKAKDYEIFDIAYAAEKYSMIMKNIAIKYDISICDCAKVFKNHKGENYLFNDSGTDFYHPTIEGHKIIADMITKLLFKEKIFQ